MPRRILSPTDFSDGSAHALAYALELADLIGAEVHAVHAYELPVYVLPEGAMAPGALPDDAIAKSAETRVEALEARHDNVTQTHVRRGPPARCIVDVAKEIGADMIVMGTHGRTGLARMLIGSVSERVVRTSHVPVVTVPPPGED